MRKQLRIAKKNHAPHGKHKWLPIDSRLIPDIISFGDVKGVARIFLTVEIVLALLIVICASILVIIASLK